MWPWILLALIVVVVVCLVVRAKKVLSPQYFIDALMRKVKSDYPDITTKEIDGFKWTFTEDGEDHTVYLNNTYARFRIYPSHFDDIVDNLIKSITAPKQDLCWDEAKSRLFPALRPQAFLDETRKLENGSQLVDELFVSDYIDDLRILLVLDTELSMSFVKNTQLEEWGVSADQALETAINNLAKLTAPHWVNANDLAQKHGFFAFNTQDGYDASRLLLPDYYERASRALGCERIAVGIPNREFLIAVSADDTDRVASVQKKVKSDFEAYDHSISPDLIFLPRQ